MRYKHVVYKDALRHEGIWLCTSHSHELLVHNPQAPNYLMTTNISQDYTYPLLVLFAGNARWFAGQRLRFVSQPGMFGIEYVRSGDALIKIGEKEIVVQPGEVYFLGETAPDEYSTGPSGRLSKRYIMLTGAAHEYLLRLLNLWDKHTIRVQAPRQFEALMRRMIRLMAENPPDVGLQTSALAYQILLALGQSIQSPLPYIVEQALGYMQKNMQQQLTLGDLCKQLEISEACLRRQFSRHLHTAPMAYFLKQKLTWSANMLCTTSLTIKEIAYNAGYEDPFYFSKQFRTQFGMSPTQYRKTHALLLDKG